MAPAYGINLRFTDGTTFYLPTTEDHSMIVAIVDEFLDACETHPQGPNFDDLPIRFLAWYAGANQDLLIKVGEGNATSTVNCVYWPEEERPRVW
jgi:hypothetical protein